MKHCNEFTGYLHLNDIVQVTLPGLTPGSAGPPEVKFIYSEKAAKFYEISTLILNTVHTVKIKVKISQNFVAFSEYMNFKKSYFTSDIGLWYMIRIQECSYFAQTFSKFVKVFYLVFVHIIQDMIKVWMEVKAFFAVQGSKNHDWIYKYNHIIQGYKIMFWTIL